jgi:hypothetical protein
MPQIRRILDEVFKLATPGFDAEYRPPPARLADGLWSLERHLRLPAGPILPSRTTVVRLGSGNLALISPPPPHDETFSTIEALGTVSALIAPNSFHYLYVNDAVRRYPDAALYLAPGLQARIATLPPGIDLRDGLPTPDLEQVSLCPAHGASEAILFHRPSRILILSDVAFNLVHLDRALDRMFWRAFGVPREFGPSRTARLMLLNDHRVVRQALRHVLEWPFERIVVAHGDVVQTDARARFERAFAAYI